MNTIFSLDGKVAIVTGGSGLLGEEFCRALSEAGAHVVVADIEIAKCMDVASSLSKKALALRVDVTEVGSLVDARKAILSQFGHIDILVNNAAINDTVENGGDAIDMAMIENFPLALWNHVMNVNVNGVFLCSQIFGSVMAEQQSGSIINIASMYGVVAPDQTLYHDGDAQRFYKSPVYPTSKSAVIGLTRYLASHWAKKNVRVNSLTPGGVLHGQDAYFVENYSRRVPMGRMANPDDYNGAIVFLASQASAYMTGANLVVDGGWTAI